MGTATSVNLFWAFVRYMVNNPYQSMETMTKQDFIRYAEEFAVANVELAVGTTAAGAYDDGLVTAATAYTDVQLPGATGTTLDSANTIALKKAAFAAATYPGVQMGKGSHATATTYDNQKLYG
jgi:hypothetical protein